MAVIHITEAEAVRDLPSLLAKVRAGEEIRIGNGPAAIAVLRALTSDPPHRTISEAIRFAETHGSKITLDDRFGVDLEDVMRLHEHEVLRDPWE